jgi:hypothetical protein
MTKFDLFKNYISILLYTNMFTCDLYNYNTDDKSNFLRHHRNKKHIEKKFAGKYIVQII